MDRSINISTAVSGTASSAIDVSDISGDWTLHLKVSAQQPVTVFGVVEETTNGFSAQRPLMIINEVGLGQQVQTTVRARELPVSKIGIIGAQIRVRFFEISGGTVDAQLRVEF